MRMYNVRLRDKVENDYKSLVGRIISCKLYPRLSLQPCVSQWTRGTPPNEGVSRHPMQGTEPYLCLAPPRSRRQCFLGSWARGPGGSGDTGFEVLDFQPRPQGFSLKKWVGREKALASAGHVHSLNIPEKLIYMQPAGFALTEVERSNNGK